MRVMQAAIKQLKPGDVIRDDDVKGCGARYRNTSVSYFLQTRVGGRLRWLTIGRHGSPWKPETARLRAREMLAAIDSGADPGAEKSARRTAPMVADAVEMFFEKHGPKLADSSRLEYERLCRLHVTPALGRKRMREVTGADVAKLHVALSDHPRREFCALGDFEADELGRAQRLARSRYQRGSRDCPLQEKTP